MALGDLKISGDGRRGTDGTDGTGYNEPARDPGVDGTSIPLYVPPPRIKKCKVLTERFAW